MVLGVYVLYSKAFFNKHLLELASLHFDGGRASLDLKITKAKKQSSWVSCWCLLTFSGACWMGKSLVEKVSATSQC